MKNLNYYENLKYPIEIVEDEDAYVASIPDLPGCVAYGDTVQEALDSLKSVKSLWLAGKLDVGATIPEPTDVDEYSGKFVLRISRGLHKALQREARQQGVSLNQHVSHILAERHQLADIERVVQEAVRKSMPAISRLTGAVAHWDFSERYHALVSVGHRRGVRHTDMKGNIEAKGVEFENCWTSHAQKKNKAHAHPHGNC
jgi:antitoxin HicB